MWGDTRDLISGPETLTPRKAMVRMSDLVIAAGGTHRIQTPVNRSRRLSIFPESRVPDEGAK
jgi:hypothetical protein